MYDYQMLVAFICVLIGYIYFRIRKLKINWKSQYGINGAEFSFLGNAPQGSLNRTINKNLIDLAIHQGNVEFKDETIYGAYKIMGGKVFVIQDPKLVKLIMVKEFDKFVDRLSDKAIRRMFKADSDTDTIWQNFMFFMRGDAWKNIRMSFSPIFTPNKMKGIMPIMQTITGRLVKLLSVSKQVDLKEICGKLSMDTIASCAFGVDLNSFEKGNQSEFVENAKNVFKFSLSSKIKLVFSLFPGATSILKALNKSVTWRDKETTFFYNFVISTLEYRKVNPQHRKNDLVDLMIDALKENREEEDDSMDENNMKLKNFKANKSKLSEISIVSTALLFLIAAYDTTSQTLSYLLYQLALNPHVQQKINK